MRGIKFRLWCKNKNNWEKDSWVITPFGGILDERHKMLLNTDNHILMQYTGLRDSQGREIFEGDIWTEGKSLAVISYKEDGFKLDWKLDRDFFSDTLRYHAKHGKVIGNIYENPELLEG